MGVDGRIEDDGSVVIQERQRLLDREVRALEVDVHDLIEEFFCHRFERRKLADSGVDEKHINLSEPLLHCGEQLVYLRQTGRVGAHG